MLPDECGSFVKRALAFGHWRTGPHMDHLGVMAVNQKRILLGKAEAIGSEDVSAAAERDSRRQIPMISEQWADPRVVERSISGPETAGLP